MIFHQLVVHLKCKPFSSPIAIIIYSQLEQQYTPQRQIIPVLDSLGAEFLSCGVRFI